MWFVVETSSRSCSNKTVGKPANLIYKYLGSLVRDINGIIQKFKARLFIKIDLI